jgi:peptidoglycan/LPS O-acetylase OafA/YrhL
LAPDALPRLRKDIPGALLYISNWVFVSREIPYFEQFGRPPLLQHLWSLAVEEQFYFVWPLLIWGILRIVRLRSPKQTSRLALPILLLAGITFALMTVIYNPQADPSRVYYGTDTRATGFLLGAALAMLWKPGTRTVRKSRLVESAALAGMLGLFWLFANLHEHATFLYRGGFLLSASLTCLVILSVSNTQTHLSRLLGCRLLRWLGTRSYGIYLWHWPLMAASSYGGAASLPNAAMLTAQLGLTFALAEVSYRWIEQPIRRHGLRTWWLDSAKGLGGLRANAASVAGMLIVAGYIFVQPTAAAPIHPTTPVPSSSISPPTLLEQDTANPSTLNTSNHNLAALASNPAAADPGSTSRPDRIQDAGAASNAVQITFIGDSIMESVAPWIEKVFTPGSYCVDALRNRRMQDVVDLIPQLVEDKCLSETVVIHLGTNVPFEDEVFDNVMQTLLENGAARVLFLNVRRPVAWEAVVNNQLLKGVNRWPQAELIDWHELSEEQAGWFCEDSVHPSYTGAATYVKIILEALDDGFSQ